VAELALHKCLFDIGSRGQTSPQGMPTKGKPPLTLGEVAPDSRR
jgi:hypothetical protein